MYRRVLGLFTAFALLATNGDAATIRSHGYTFEARIVGPSGRGLSEQRRNGRPTLFVHEGDEYAVVIQNPLPVRVGVALSIDGLNSIDGKRTTPSEGAKWIIEPHGRITIRGWQTDHDKLRRFVFTRDEDSYAEWKEQQDRTDYSPNLGVIGVAWFWSSSELEWALRPPQPFAEDLSDRAMGAEHAPKPSAKRRCAPEGESRQRAGTGMGRREDNRVREVEFSFDAGMYGNDDVLAIHYEFAREIPQPKPFLEQPRKQDFAPDMHSRRNTRHREPWWRWW
ncbi:MAG: hypothetical protein GF331_25185 [Chitinivibrionales bacterium]|nr:hypothetical protein [Chitinivibrionales bacterium]